MRHLITLLFAILIFSCKESDKAAKVFSKEDNIYVAFSNGQEKQLTFNATDKDPILFKKEGLVVFTRKEKSNAIHENYEKHKIMKVDINTLFESIITDQKPFQDGLNGTYDIINVINPTISLDGKFVYFITEKYATGNELVKVNIETGEWTELFSAESFELINKEPYLGLFLIGKSEIGYKGRDIYYKLCDEKGNVKKEFDSEDGLMGFRSEIK